MESCDNVWNCNNHEDENVCAFSSIVHVYPSLKRLQPPGVIYFDGFGDFISTRSPNVKPRKRSTEKDIAEWNSNVSQNNNKQESFKPSVPLEHFSVTPSEMN